MLCAPYKRLVAAVINQAIEDVWFKDPKKPTSDAAPKKIVAYKAALRDATAIREDARYWLSSKDEVPYSFVWCCGLLNIDPYRASDLILGGPITISELKRRVRLAEKMRKSAIDNE